MGKGIEGRCLKVGLKGFGFQSGLVLTFHCGGCDEETLGKSIESRTKGWLMEVQRGMERCFIEVDVKLL